MNIPLFISIFFITLGIISIGISIFKKNISSYENSHTPIIVDIITPPKKNSKLARLGYFLNGLFLLLAGSALLIYILML